MRRRTFLAAIPAAAVLAGCGEGSPDAVVKIATKPTTVKPAGVPATTPTALPLPELVTSANDVYQGGALLVSLVGGVKAGSVTFLDRTNALSPGAKSIYSFVGIGTEDPPGVHPLRIDFTTDAGSKGSLNAQANVLPTAWTVDSVTISAKLAALLDPQVQADEAKLLAQVYSNVTNTKLWTSAWLQPVGGGVTTRFGEERSYNGAPLAGHHSGTDIGAPEGIPVGATNNGRVVLARQLRLRGNMVVVDHGGGLFSGYAHLSSFAVAEGQTVEAGETVGYVGSTGLSTAAHLHWEMASNGLVVDAFRFLDGTNGF